jgi:hypothetical protein
MRQTSEEFANAMIDDVIQETPQPSMTEMLAETEKRITEKLAESQQALFDRIGAINTSVDTTDDTSPDVSDVETTETTETTETNEE